MHMTEVCFSGRPSLFTIFFRSKFALCSCVPFPLYWPATLKLHQLVLVFMETVLPGITGTDYWDMHLLAVPILFRQCAYFSLLLPFLGSAHCCKATNFRACAALFATSWAISFWVYGSTACTLFLRQLFTGCPLLWPRCRLFCLCCDCINCLEVSACLSVVG